MFSVIRKTGLSFVSEVQTGSPFNLLTVEAVGCSGRTTSWVVCGDPCWDIATSDSAWDVHSITGVWVQVDDRGWICTVCCACNVEVARHYEAAVESTGHIAGLHLDRLSMAIDECKVQHSTAVAELSGCSTVPCIGQEADTNGHTWGVVGVTECKGACWLGDGCQGHAWEVARSVLWVSCWR